MIIKFYNLDLKTVYDYFEYLKLSKPFTNKTNNEFLADYLEEINEENVKLASFPQFKEYVLKKY